MSKNASMNHCFRSVWNEALGAMVAVSEFASASGTRTSNACVSGKRTGRLQPGKLSQLVFEVALAWGLVMPSAHANPVGGVAIHGQANAAPNGSALNVITQNGSGTSHSAINWQSFSIPVGSSTHFQQPSAISTSINRVITNTPSAIFGALSSNGNLVLVNQAGITVGAGAVVDTAGFTASVLRMTDADAISGRLRFGDGNATSAGLSIKGSILARSGDVVLLAPNIDTGKDALIQAPNGNTLLAAGQQVELTGRGLEGIKMVVQAPSNAALNLGTLKGNAVAIFAGTLKHSGDIQANTVSLEGGKIVLKALADAYVEGSGKLTATGTLGGTVDVLGNRVAVTDQAAIDVSGELGGGTVRIGGDYLGKNLDIQNASFTYTGAQTSIKADALTSGNGGKVIVWADDTTRAYGAISATGGTQSGDGGFIETSGKRALDVAGARVAASAPNGANGQWLLDPSDLTIIRGTASQLSVGLFDPASNQSSQIGDDQINAALIGTNVMIQTENNGGGTGTILVNGSDDIGGAVVIGNSSNIGYSLILRTAGSINIRPGATINRASAGGSVYLKAGNNVIVDGDLNTATTDIQASGTISGTGALVSQSLITQSTTGTLLNGSRNQVRNWTATNSGTGNVQLTNLGNINLGPITNANGFVTVTSTNGISVNSNIRTNGSITLAAGAGDLVQTSGTISNVGEGNTGSPGMSMGGNNITLRSVQSAGGVSLNATGGVNLLGLGSGGYIDDTFFSYNLPFTFNYFGTNYNQAFITTNGLVTFGSGTTSYTDSISSLGYLKAIAPAWNDWTLDASAGKDIRIAPFASSLGVRWNVARCCGGVTNTTPAAQFETILNSNGAIRFNYGAANSTFANDVTIGISNGSGINLISALMNEPNFSMNNLRSTTFTPNGEGSYTETLSAGSTPLSVFGTISGSAILGQGTGEVINAAGLLRINAGGSINAPSRLRAQSLQFLSSGGALFTGENIFRSIGTSANSGQSSEISINNTGLSTQLSPLALADLVNNSGGITVNNIADIDLTGQLRATGEVALTAQTGAITQTTTESSAGVFVPSLLTSSATGTTLNYSGNQIGSFSAINAVSGNVELVNTGGLAAANIDNRFGSISVRDTTGNLNLGPLNATSITLSALNGNITQNAGFSTAGLLATESTSSTTLDHGSNRIGSLSARTTGEGSLNLTNLGPIDILGINVANGNITVNNTGGIRSNTAAIAAPRGRISMTANSPLTIGFGGVAASGDIVLAATNLTSAGNMTLNGPVTSSSGSIAMSAATNLVQNGAVSAALGVTASAGVNLTFGPLATTVGSPVVYTSNGAAAVAPRGAAALPVIAPPTPVVAAPPPIVAAPTPEVIAPAAPISSSPADLVVAFLSSTERVLSNKDLDTLDPDKTSKKTKDGVVTEAQTCPR